MRGVEIQETSRTAEWPVDLTSGRRGGGDGWMRSVLWRKFLLHRRNDTMLFGLYLRAPPWDGWKVWDELAE